VKPDRLRGRVKRGLLRTISRLHLLLPVYRVYEAVRAVRFGRGPSEGEAGGLPVPPRRLLITVAGNPDPAWFLESGRQTAGAIRGALERRGVAIEQVGAMLDFGCGCGRVVRHWADLPRTRLVGSDYNARLVAWCRANLPHAHFDRNELAPPTRYDHGEFDVVYALSVFTHLPQELQHRWLDEFARVLRPGGHLLLTLHGDPYLERLTADEQAAFRRGELVVRWAEVAGSNLCTAFHPRTWIASHLRAPLDLVEQVDEGAVGMPRQDLYVFQRRA
jgi:SAM-dependent methyltransferase